MQYKDNKTLLQLRDCALNVAKKINKLAVAEMFSKEIYIARDCLKWFNKKFKSKNIELSDDVKRKYEIENPIDWIEGCYCICKFPLEILTQQILTQQKNKCLMLIFLFLKSTNF